MATFDLTKPFDLSTTATKLGADVTPSNTIPASGQQFEPSLIRIGDASGTLRYKDLAGNTINHTVAAAGEFLPTLAVAVLTAGTTVTAITRHFN